MPTEINQIIASSLNIRHRKGDTLQSIIIPFTLNGDPIDLTGFTFNMTIFDMGNTVETPIVTFTNNSGITVDAEGFITIYHITALNSLSAGDYEYKITSSDAIGRTVTWYEGYFLNHLSN